MFPRALGVSGTIAGRQRLRGATAKLATGTAALALTWGLSACGGGGKSQDADEPTGNFPVEVAKASFPDRQQLVESSDLELEINNAGNETIPNLAVTIYTTRTPAPAGQQPKANRPFGIRVNQPDLADPTRPVWILEHNFPKLIPPGAGNKGLGRAPSAGAAAAQTDTFQFGAVLSGESKDIVWRVTPVRPGTYTVHYEVAAGLYGNAKAVTSDGGPVKGEFPVEIESKPKATCVKGASQVTTRCRKA
jgi:hypothetical protein